MLLHTTTKLPFASDAFATVVAAEVMEHVFDTQAVVAELARVLADDGTVFFLTPNAPADFENPFHIHLFEPPELRALLAKYFHDVTVQGLDAVPRVKVDFTARRVKAEKVFWRRGKLRSNVELSLADGTPVAQGTIAGMGVRRGR